MNSTKLLLSTFRRAALVYVIIEVALVFLLGMSDIRPNRVSSVFDSFGVSFIIALILNLIMWIQINLNRLPFPVSLRQRAYLPVLSFALIWCSGGAAIILALFCLGIAPFRLALFLGKMIPFIPLYALLFLVLLRFVRRSPFLIMIVWFGFMTPGRDKDYFVEAYLSSYLLWWPLIFALIAFYLYEGPFQVASNDRLLAGKPAAVWGFGMLDFLINPRRRLLSRVLDLLENMFLLFVIVTYLTIKIDFFTIFDTEPGAPFSRGKLLACLIYFGFFILILRDISRHSRASGFNGLSALGVTLMQATLALYPLAQALGVKKGVHAWCDQCRKLKYVWASHCPHCGNPGAGTIANKKLAKVAQGKSPVSYDRTALLRNVFIPLQLIIMFVIFGGIANEPFVAHHMVLGAEHFAEEEKSRAVATKVQALVEENPDPVAWIASVEPTDDSIVHIPKQFRVDVKIMPSGMIIITGHGLRWDEAKEFAEFYAQLLAREAGKVIPIRLSDITQARSRSSFLSARYYLDNRAHWED